MLTFLSENVLLDTVYSIGIMICFYYGLTAFACVWFFRRKLFIDPFSVVFKFLLPLVGGIMLAFVFVVSALRDLFSPEFGSGGSIGGVGLVFIMGVGLILFGFSCSSPSNARGIRPSSAARLSKLTPPR